VQVNPETATTVYVATPRGGELTLDPGREVVARVVASDGAGGARINLAGQVVEVRTDAPLRVGDEVRLSVTQADAAGVRLAIVTPEGASTGGRPGLPPAGAALVQELAKAGVPVTPQLASAVSQVAEQLGGSSTAARAVANLAGRDLVLSPAAAGRVSAALDLAGSMGPALSSLAARSSEVAAALPSGAPSAAALRSLLAPSLSNGELAMARIIQATQASAPGGPMTLPAPPTSSSASVIQNYVSSQVAMTSNLDELASQNTTLGTASLLQARGATTAPATATTATTGLAADALQAAIRGQAASTSAAVTGSVALPGTAAGAATPPTGAAAMLSLVDPGRAGAAGSSTPATAAQAQQAATSTARANASAAAATGAAAAMPTPTGAVTAGAVADLAVLATRFAPAIAPGAGGIGTVGADASRGTNAAAIAQQAGRPGDVAAATASVAGSSSSDDPVPVVTSLQQFLASPGSQGDAARMLRSFGDAGPAALAMAIRTLPEGDALKLAGALLDLLPDGSKLAGPALHDLRAGVHAALDRLGASLLPPGGDDIAALRAVLEQVAANDPRPGVAGDAARLLAAVDGQQILSRTASGADPGYVYFQVPMPDGRGAEVLVRREPGRRAVSFDEFRIAFLLSTEHVGTLMIELDAHPAGIRADVRTDVPELEPFLRERSEALIEPLARESRRAVTVTTGVFEQEPPTSLLEPQLGALEPGSNEFYA
jgi:hypothetical protein